MALLLLARHEKKLTRTALEKRHPSRRVARPLSSLQAGDTDVVLDGAHNPAGITTFCKTYEDVFGDRKRVFLFSVLADKDYSQMVRELFHEDDYVICAPAPTPRTSDPKEMANLVPCKADWQGVCRKGSIRPLQPYSRIRSCASSDRSTSRAKYGHIFGKNTSFSKLFESARNGLLAHRVSGLSMRYRKGVSPHGGTPFSLRRSGPYDKIKHIFTEERTYMKWMIRTGSTPAERARLRVVYALAGTVFFMPLNLFVMEGFFVVALLLGLYYMMRYPRLPLRRAPLSLPAVGFAVAAFFVAHRSPHFFMGTAFYVFTVLQYILLYYGILVFVHRSWERRMLFSALLFSAFAVALYGLYQYATCWS